MRGVNTRWRPRSTAIRSRLPDNLWLRTASRRAAATGTVSREHFLRAGRRAKSWTGRRSCRDRSAKCGVTCRKSRLYHSDAVAERILGAIARVLLPGLRIVSARHEDVEGEDVDAGETGKIAPKGDAAGGSQSL